jgi:hypothetical protein
LFSPSLSFSLSLSFLLKGADTLAEELGGFPLFVKPEHGYDSELLALFFLFSVPCFAIVFVFIFVLFSSCLLSSRSSSSPSSPSSPSSSSSSSPSSSFRCGYRRDVCRVDYRSSQSAN